MSWSVAKLVCILFTSPPHPNTRDEDVGDESGWKQIKGDVFRSPPRLLLFSALVGTGTLLTTLVAIRRLVCSYRLLLPTGHQLVILVFCLLCLAALGTYYAQRGTVVTAFIICYALTSFIAGYGGGGYYARNGGKKWIKCTQPQTRWKNAHSFSLSDC